MCAGGAGGGGHGVCAPDPQRPSEVTRCRSQARYRGKEVLLVRTGNVRGPDSGHGSAPVVLWKARTAVDDNLPCELWHVPVEQVVDQFVHAAHCLAKRQFASTPKEQSLVNLTTKRGDQFQINAELTKLADSVT